MIGVESDIRCGAAAAYQFYQTAPSVPLQPSDLAPTVPYSESHRPAACTRVGTDPRRESVGLAFRVDPAALVDLRAISDRPFGAALPDS